MLRLLSGLLPKSLRRRYEEYQAGQRAREEYRRRLLSGPASEVERFVGLPAASQAPQVEPTPTTLPSAQLIHIDDQGQTRATYPLSQLMQTGRVLIGRGHAHISISDDPAMSPRHAMIEPIEGEYRLCDLGSSLGTFLRCQKAPVQDLDQILIGWYLFELQVVRQDLDLDSRLEPFNSLDAPGPTKPPVDPYDPTSPAMGSGDTIQVGSLPVNLQAKLVRILPQGQKGEVYPFDRTLVIGRIGCDVALSENSYVSRRHAMIVQQSGRFELRDLGSKNGTFMRLRRPVQLKHGDCFITGRQFFRFELLKPSAPVE